MLEKELLLLVLASFASARHYIPDLKPGTFGFMIDGQLIKTWTPDEFDEWRSTNPLVELLLVAGYPYLKPGTQGSTNAGTSPVGPTSVSQASSSVGNGGSFASAGVRPVASTSNGVPDAQVFTTHLPPSTTRKLEISTEPSDPPTSTELSTTASTEDKVTPDDNVSTSQTSDNTNGKTPKPLTESSFLDINVTTKSNEQDGEKSHVSIKDNEIINQEKSTGENVLSKDPSSSTSIKTASGDAMTNSGRPAVSRPGFSSATSAASASSQVHAEGSSLAESPGSSSKGTSESNSNSASIVYGEFAGSVSISSSSSTG